RARAQGGVGHMAVDADDTALAKRLFAEALPVLRERNDTLGLATALRGVGDLDWRSGDRGRARASFAEAAELFEQLGDFGAVAGRLNEVAEAGHCWALFERFEEREGFHLGRVTPVDYQARVAALDPVERAVFDAACTAAGDVPLDEAIAEVGSRG